MVVTTDRHSDRISSHTFVDFDINSKAPAGYSWTSFASIYCIGFDLSKTADKYHNFDIQSIESLISFDIMDLRIHQLLFLSCLVKTTNSAPRYASYVSLKHLSKWNDCFCNPKACR